MGRMNAERHSLHDHRLNYHGALLPDDLEGFDPWACFGAWFEDAMDEKAAGRLAEPNAMVVSTVGSVAGAAGVASSDGGVQPSSRVVLLKEWSPMGLVFFTHETSRKGREIGANPLVSLLFWWPSLMRQIRVEGSAVPVARDEVESYFATRPRGSRVGAWASHQSEPMASRDELERAVAEAETRFADAEVPCPPTWGGYRVAPRYFEFWSGQPSRLHERVAATLVDGQWNATRLNP